MAMKRKFTKNAYNSIIIPHIDMVDLFKYRFLMWAVFKMRTMMGKFV